MTSSQLYFRLLRYVTPYWFAFLVSILGLVLVAATEPALPALMKPMLDQTFVERDQLWVKLIPVLIIFLFLVRGIASYIGSVASSWVGNKVVTDLRAAMFRKLMVLPTQYYDDHPSGNLISKITFDVAQVTTAATSVVTIVIKDSLSIIGLLGYLFYLNWKLTLIALIMTPIIIVIVRVFSVRLRKMSRETQRAMGDITQVLDEAVDCHKVVKVFGGQDYETTRFVTQANRVRQFTMKQASAAAANVPIVQMVASVALAVIVYLAARHSDHTSVGSFVSFIVAMLMLTAPLKRLTGVNEHLQRGLAAAESVFELLDQEAERDHGTFQLARAKGEVRFEKINFSYPYSSRPALTDIDLIIRPGEMIALVGVSGSGKTTLVNLLPRFYHPTSGKIYLDGQELESLTLESLRKNIALVSQDVALFNDTVAANIAYGALGAVSESEVIDAALAAHALEFIREMPQGLQTLVGENGVRLSGGQRQRLAIARALLKNAPLLILDEATSALDSESERHIQAALETLLIGRTNIVIAHRMSTVEKADRIIVLDQGRVVESGSHGELLAQNGRYAKLFHLQFNLGGSDRGKVVATE